MTDFTVLSCPPWCTLSHSCDSLCQHELPCWFTNTMILLQPGQCVIEGGGDVRGTPKFHCSNSVTLWLMWHFAILITQYMSHIGLPLPCHPPFYFCALLLPSYSISISFHILFPILSIFHILSLSLFCDLLLVAMHSVPYVVPLCLGSP